MLSENQAKLGALGINEADDCNAIVLLLIKMSDIALKFLNFCNDTKTVKNVFRVLVYS